MPRAESASGIEAGTTARVAVGVVGGNKEGQERFDRNAQQSRPEVYYSYGANDNGECNAVGSRVGLGRGIAELGCPQ